jgi:hypothetical protein
LSGIFSTAVIMSAFSLSSMSVMTRRFPFASISSSIASLLNLGCVVWWHLQGDVRPSSAAPRADGSLQDNLQFQVAMPGYQIIDGHLRRVGAFLAVQPKRAVLFDQHA